MREDMDATHSKRAWMLPIQSVPGCYLFKACLHATHLKRDWILPI